MLPVLCCFIFLFPKPQNSSFYLNELCTCTFFCCYLGKLWVSVSELSIYFIILWPLRCDITLIFQNGSSSLHFTIDEERLAGYCEACEVLTSSSDDASQQATPYSQIHSCMKSGKYQVECLNNAMCIWGGGLSFCVEDSIWTGRNFKKFSILNDSLTINILF